MLQENLINVQAKIDAALARRTEEKITGNKVTLVAVTKNHPAEVITDAFNLGVSVIGENRVQEAKAKREAEKAAAEVKDATENKESK